MRDLGSLGFTFIFFSFLFFSFLFFYFRHFRADYFLVFFTFVVFSGSGCYRGAETEYIIQFLFKLLPGMHRSSDKFMEFDYFSFKLQLFL